MIKNKRWNHIILVTSFTGLFLFHSSPYSWYPAHYLIWKSYYLLVELIKEARGKEVNRGVSMKVLDRRKMKSCPNKLRVHK